MKDIVERLRAMSRHEHDDLTVGDEAAAEVERLILRVESLLGVADELHRLIAGAEWRASRPGADRRTGR